MQVIAQAGLSLIDHFRCQVLRRHDFGPDQTHGCVINPVTKTIWPTEPCRRCHDRPLLGLDENYDADGNSYPGTDLVELRRAGFVEFVPDQVRWPFPDEAFSLMVRGATRSQLYGPFNIYTCGNGETIVLRDAA
jgi:hypothetical protein